MSDPEMTLTEFLIWEVLEEEAAAKGKPVPYTREQVRRWAEGIWAETNQPLREIKRAVMCLKRGFNWDGLGARAITARTCERTIRILHELACAGLPEPTSLAPSRTGAVGITWKNGSRALYVEVSRAPGLHVQTVGLPGGIDESITEVGLCRLLGELFDEATDESG